MEIEFRCDVCGKTLICEDRRMEDITKDVWYIGLCPDCGDKDVLKEVERAQGEID
jgi:DNA-directed RNA polymerase subunit RPC12/RpoP